MIVAQGTIFWIGYSDDPWRRTIATVLSYVVLFAGVGFDFLSPILQRHRQRYSVMVKSFAAHPLLFFGFGALFALPAIITARVVASHTDWSHGTQLAFSFGAQVIGIALAAIGGTVAGAPLLADAKTRKPSKAPARIAIVARADRPARVERPPVLPDRHVAQPQEPDPQVRVRRRLGQLLGGSAERAGLATAYRTDAITVGVHFDVAITNPTSVTVEIEDNRLEVRQADQLVATTRCHGHGGARRDRKVTVSCR